VVGRNGISGEFRGGESVNNAETAQASPLARNHKIHNTSRRFAIPFAKRAELDQSSLGGAMEAAETTLGLATARHGRKAAARNITACTHG